MTPESYKGWRRFGEPPRVVNSAIQWGTLIVVLFLFGWMAYLMSQRKPTHTTDPLLGYLVPGMLILNHIAFQFRYPFRVTVALRLVAVEWFAFTMFYLASIEFIRGDKPPQKAALARAKPSRVSA